MKEKEKTESAYSVSNTNNYEKGIMYFIFIFIELAHI